MKKIIAFLFIVAFFVAANAVFASPGNKYGKAETPPFPQPAEKDLHKVVFIRYAPGKEPVCDDDGICEPRENWKKCPNDCPKGDEEPTPPPEESTCYGFFSGAKPKWNQPENYYYEAGLGGVSEWATDTWEAVTAGDIFGGSIPGYYAWGVYDYRNAISYGNYDDPNVIAVAAIWFQAKTIYEYDIMFDTNYFPGEIDLDTVALHEFGHGAGLNDLYKSECQGEVMYGYYEGEKTVLGEGDIIGIQTLYGTL